MRVSRRHMPRIQTIRTGETNLLLPWQLVKACNVSSRPQRELTVYMLSRKGTRSRAAETIAQGGPQLYETVKYPSLRQAVVSSVPSKRNSSRTVAIDLPGKDVKPPSKRDSQPLVS